MKTIILALCIAVILALIGVVGYQYYWDKNIEDVTNRNADIETEKNRDVDEHATQNTRDICHKLHTGNYPLFPLVFPENKVDTSNWKVYRNEKFGFEIKYPVNWEVEFDGMPGLSYPGERGYLGEFSVFPTESQSNRIDVFSMYANSLGAYIVSITNSELGFPGYVKKFYLLNNTVGVHALSQSSEIREVDFIERYTLEGACNTVILFDLADRSNDGKYAKELQAMFLTFSLLNNL